MPVSKVHSFGNWISLVKLLLFHLQPDFPENFRGFPLLNHHLGEIGRVFGRYNLARFFSEALEKGGQQRIARKSPLKNKRQQLARFWDVHLPTYQPTATPKSKSFWITFLPSLLPKQKISQEFPEICHLRHPLWVPFQTDQPSSDPNGKTWTSNPLLIPTRSGDQKLAHQDPIFHPRLCGARLDGEEGGRENHVVPWNAKCPIFLRQLLPLKLATIALKIGHLFLFVFKRFKTDCFRITWDSGKTEKWRNGGFFLCWKRISAWFPKSFRNLCFFGFFGGWGKPM